MSIQNMSYKNTATENTLNFHKENNNNTNNSIHLRDQFNAVFAELFKNSKKEENQNFDNLSTLKETSQEEKKRELEINIAMEEKRINELEKLKKEKLIKVIIYF